MTVSHYPVVTIYVEINDKRTLDQKRRLARLITEASVGVLGADPEDVSVRFRILSYENMARAGTLLSDRQRPEPRRSTPRCRPKHRPRSTSPPTASTTPSAA